MDTHTAGFEARQVREAIQRAQTFAERAQRAVEGDADLTAKAAAVVAAVDAAQLRVTELRHELAQRALTDGYRTGR